jgi:Zn-dependent protease with chaperone function
VRWYQLAAAQGDPAAQYNLGAMSAKGQGVAQDDKEAVRWYQLAAQQGNARSQFNLGGYYYNGRGVAQDYAEAVRWWKLAAAQGDAQAQFNLGVAYAKGQGVAQDDKEATRLFQLAAQQGDARSQFNLGSRYYRGEGVAQDYSEAVRWWKTAAAQGQADAKKWLEIAEKKASETATTAAISNQTETRIEPTDAEKERRKRQDTEELLARDRKTKTAELEAANKKQKDLEARLREATKVKTISTLNVDTKRTNIEEVDRLKSLLITEISDEVTNEAIYADRSWLATGQINDQKVTFQRGDSYTRIERIVNRLLDSVNIDSTKWAVRVVDTEEKTENAFVTGGRIIYVYTGLIENAKNDDELALVLGHEIGHSLLKHNKERVDNSLATLVGSLAKLGALLSKNEQSRDKLEFVGDAITTFYKRDHEREADAFGAYIANKAGYRYGEGKNFFVRTSNQSKAIEAQNEAKLAQATQEINSQFENCELQKQRYNSNVLYRTRANAEIVNQVCQLAMQNAERLRGFQKQKIKNLFIRTHPVDDERISNLELIQSYMSCRTGEQGLERIGVGSYVLRALDFKPQCK